MEQLTLHGNNEALFERISSYEQLKASWKLVKANRGSSGVDGQTLDEFEMNLKDELNQLSTELREWKYQPQPVRRVEIPKPGSKEKRKLGIPTVRDRVVQQSVRLSLEPLYEPEFSEFSFGFRPGRGQQDAIEAAQCITASGKDWVVDIDLEKFFDRIHHDRLIQTLRGKVKDNRVLRLIGLTLRSGVLHGGRAEPSTEGSPQGSPLSPLLSNIVLDELDRELERRGLMFCRYADDAKIFVSSEKAANRVMSSVSRFIERKLKLVVNKSKSQVARTKDVVFLGFVVTGWTVRISRKSMKRAMNKVRELVPRGTHAPIEEGIRRVNEWYRGWAAYYQLTSYPFQLHLIEAHLRRRIRAQFVSNAKRKRTLVRKVRALGVERRHAYRSIYRGDRRRWALSRAQAVEAAWNNSWFRRQGLLDLSNCALPHWYPLHFRVL